MSEPSLASLGRRAPHGRAIHACVSALLALTGCQLDPEGSAARRDTEVDDVPVAQRDPGKDAAAPPKSGSTPMMTAIDGSAASPLLDAAAPAVEQADGSISEAGSEPVGPGMGPGMSPGMGTEVPPDGCKVAGTFALETEIDVAWDGSSVAGLALIAGGTGKVIMRSLTVLDGDPRQATLRPCGLSLPDFETAPGSVIGKELYGMDVPVAVWDQAAMPSWQIPWGLSCEKAGCSIFSGMVEAVVGARVTSVPFDWPAAGEQQAGFQVRDDDADNLPGLTLITRGPDSPRRGDQPYAYPPLVTSLLSRARAVMVAIGMRAQMQGTLESCDRYTGSLSFGGVYARALGCRKQFGNRRDAPCEASDMEFLDAHLPVWRVKSGSFVSARIETPSCAAVRAFDFAN